MGECFIVRASGGIDTSDALASESTILSGYTAYVNDEKVTGSITNRGSVTSSLNPGEIYTVLEGYHDDTGVISVSSLSLNTSGTAQNGWILSGYNAWVNGNKLVGTMNNRGSQSWNLAVNGTQIIWSGFYDGNGKVSQSLTTSSGGTWTPTTSNKTLVNTSTWVSEAWYVVGASTLVAANIKKDVNIFGVKGTFTGWVDSNIYVIKNGVVQSGFITPIKSFTWWADQNGGMYNDTNTPLTFSSSNGQWTSPSHYVYGYNGSEIYGYRPWVQNKMDFSGDIIPVSFTIDYGIQATRRSSSHGSLYYQLCTAVWYTRTKISTGVTSTRDYTDIKDTIRMDSKDFDISAGSTAIKTGTITLTPSKPSDGSTYTYKYQGQYSFGIINPTFVGVTSDAFSANIRFFITNFIVNLK